MYEMKNHLFTLLDAQISKQDTPLAVGGRLKMSRWEKEKRYYTEI